MRDKSEDLLSDLIDAQLRYLRGEGPEPDLTDLGTRDRAEAQRLLDLVDALADSLPASPPMREDPVAVQLGLLEEAPPRAWPLGDADPIIVSVQEVSYRLNGAIRFDVVPHRRPNDAIAALLCRSLAEAILLVISYSRDAPRTSQDAIPIFQDQPDLSAVAFCTPDATRAVVCTYGESVDRLIPARDWAPPADLEWESLGIALGRHFERSIPPWDEVNRLASAGSLDELKIEISRAIDDKLGNAARSRPRLSHKRDARDFVVNVDKMHIQSWIDAVRGNRISGEQLAAEIADVCEASTP